MYQVSYPRVERQGRGVDHPPTPFWHRGCVWVKPHLELSTVPSGQLQGDPSICYMRNAWCKQINVRLMAKYVILCNYQIYVNAFTCPVRSKKKKEKALCGYHVRPSVRLWPTASHQNVCPIFMQLDVEPLQNLPSKAEFRVNRLWRHSFCPQQMPVSNFHASWKNFVQLFTEYLHLKPVSICDFSEKPASWRQFM